MRKAAFKREKNVVYTVDLTKIDGDGSFPCPRCGTTISPDDESDEVYEIVDTVVKGTELAELVIHCKRCGSTIRLVGFLQLSEL
jgi:predicted RNA-binding Zn-ribbon protein involved in translation (DUF1610 family)